MRRWGLLLILGRPAAPEPCGAAVWCLGDVDCSFEQLPVVEQYDGVTYTVPYYSSAGDIMAAGADSGAELALIVSHGAVPNPGGYFCAGMDAVVAQSGVDPGRVIVIAPWYLGSGADTEPTPSQLQWTAGAHAPLSGDWRDGGDSDPAGGRPGNVSSYRVIDIIVERLLLSGAFPSLRGAVLWGDSAGGQVLARYALATHLPAQATQRLRIFPSNPSSFPYLDSRRWNYTFPDERCTLGEFRELDDEQLRACPGADQWRYGVAGLLPPYVVAGLDLARFPTLAVTYLQGTLSTRPAAPSSLPDRTGAPL